MARPKKIKQVEQQISSRSLEEIQRLQAPFKKTMGEIHEAIKYQYGWIKKKVQHAAKQLEESGTVEIDHICSMVVLELKPELESGLIHLRWIYKIFEDKGYEKYKQEQYVKLAERMKNWQENIPAETSQVLQHWTGLKSDEVIRTPVDVAISSTTLFRKNLIISWSDEDIIFARQVLAVSVPILSDTLKLVEEEWQARRLKAKMLSR